MYCPSCNFKKIITKKINHQTFTHLNFDIFQNRGSKINYCKNCDLIKYKQLILALNQYF